MKRLILAALLLITGISIAGCSDTSNSPLTWTQAEIENFVEQNAGLSNLNLTATSGKPGHYEGEAVFDEEKVKCNVVVSKKRISWEAKSDPVTTVGEDGSTKTTGGLGVSGSRAF